MFAIRSTLLMMDFYSPFAFDELQALMENDLLIFGKWAQHTILMDTPDFNISRVARADWSASALLREFFRCLPR
jgi:hypothetical protein